MRKILTHFSRNFAKIAKEIKYFNLPTTIRHYSHRRFVYTKSSNFLFYVQLNEALQFLTVNSDSLKPGEFSVICYYVTERLWLLSRNIFQERKKFLFFHIVPLKYLVKLISRKKRTKIAKSIVVLLQSIWRKNIQLEIDFKYEKRL